MRITSDEKDFIHDAIRHAGYELRYIYDVVKSLNVEDEPLMDEYHMLRYLQYILGYYLDTEDVPGEPDARSIRALRLRIGEQLNQHNREEAKRGFTESGKNGD